jgi:putative transposase
MDHPWPHAPVHQLRKAGVFLVTSSTLHKQPFFTDGPRLRMLHDALLTIADRHAWRLEAWAVFLNHYHFVGVSPSDPGSLKEFIQELHSRTAIALNRADQIPSRAVWHNYWEPRLTHLNSYLARLNYVHQNPVKHGLVALANQYPQGSAAWFERTATPAQVQTIYSFKIDRVNINDNY